MRLYLKHRIHFKTTNSGLGNSPKSVKRSKKEKDKKKKKKKKKTPGRSENNPIEIIDSSTDEEEDPADIMATEEPELRAGLPVPPTPHR